MISYFSRLARPPAILSTGNDLGRYKHLLLKLYASNDSTQCKSTSRDLNSISSNLDTLTSSYYSRPNLACRDTIRCTASPPPTVARTPYAAPDTDAQWESAGTDTREDRRFPRRGLTHGRAQPHGISQRRGRRGRYCCRYTAAAAATAVSAFFGFSTEAAAVVAAVAAAAAVAPVAAAAASASLGLALVACGASARYTTRPSSVRWPGRAKGCGAHQSNSIIKGRVLSAPIVPRAAWDEAPVHVCPDQRIVSCSNMGHGGKGARFTRQPSKECCRGITRARTNAMHS